MADYICLLKSSACILIDCTLQEASSTGLGLSDLLIMPIQRVPRYRLLLEELCKHTPATHSDATHCLRALAGVKVRALFFLYM